MTVIQALPDEALTAGIGRASFIAGLVDAYTYLATHEDVPVPGCATFSYEVPAGLTSREKLRWLQGIARALAVPVTVNHGVYSAYREFGLMRIGAHIDFGATARIITAQDAVKAEGPAAA